MLDDKNNPFTYSVLPFDLEFPDNPRPPAPEAEEDALHHICVQLVTNLTSAAKESRSDPLKAIRVLAYCVAILDDYANDGFTGLAEFRDELQTDLHNALRKARRFFLRQMFLCSKDKQPAYLQTLRDTGWRTSNAEALEDYNTVVEELFDGDHFRRSTLAERQRRNGMA